MGGSQDRLLEKRSNIYDRKGRKRGFLREKVLEQGAQPSLRVGRAPEPDRIGRDNLNGLIPDSDWTGNEVAQATV